MLLSYTNNFHFGVIFRDPWEIFVYLKGTVSTVQSSDFTFLSPEKIFDYTRKTGSAYKKKWSRETEDHVNSFWYVDIVFMYVMYVCMFFLEMFQSLFKTTNDELYKHRSLYKHSRWHTLPGLCLHFYLLFHEIH